MNNQQERAKRLHMNPITAMNQPQSILKMLAQSIHNGGNSSVRASSLPISGQLKRTKIDTDSKYTKTFQEIKKIGQGNFSIVFKCKNVVDNCIYAVKKTQAQFKTLIEKSEARQEACILAELFSKSSHPNIVQYYQSWIEQNQFYLVMEYCDYNLKHQLVYQEWEIKYILRHVLNGLNFLHNQQYVHMDIKPENILFKKQDLCYKISDFGLARSKHLKDQEEFRDGDCRYGAPEIIEYMNYYNPIDLIKVDIFALGCTIFQLMNQIELPKQDEEYHELRKGITKNHFRDVGIQYSDGLISLVLQMMSPDPKNRPTTYQLLNSKYLAIPMMNEIRYFEICNNLMKQKLNFIRNNMKKKNKCQSYKLLETQKIENQSNQMEIEDGETNNQQIDQNAIDFNRNIYDQSKKNKESNGHSRNKSI